MIRIAPSILSADFTKLGSEISDVLSAGADWIHFDVMDGVFVPNITVGLPVLKSVREFTDAFLDVHLMITNPLKLVKIFCQTGADMLTFHLEAESEKGIVSAIDEIHNCGKMAGLAIRPDTPAEKIEKYIDRLEMVLVMTVQPGKGGQKFMFDQLEKISAVREMISSINPTCLLQVDGGINAETAALCCNAGADTLVAGSYVFNAADRKSALSSLR